MSECRICTTVRDVEAVKKHLKIGDLVETPTVVHDFENQKCEFVEKRLLPVIRKYKYLAEVRDPKNGRLYTVPYTTIALSRRKVGEAE